MRQVRDHHLLIHQLRLDEMRRHLSPRHLHMRGITLALRTNLGVPGLDHASEFPELNRLRVHLFDCFALVNRLLCSAHVSGTTSNGKSDMRLIKEGPRPLRNPSVRELTTNFFDTGRVLDQLLASILINFG